MAQKILIYLNDEGSAAMQSLAAKELRRTRDQVMYVIRKELRRQGLLDAGRNEPDAVLIGRRNVRKDKFLRN